MMHGTLSWHQSRGAWGLQLVHERVEVSAQDEETGSVHVPGVVNINEVINQENQAMAGGEEW
jgi:hypothetical protein